MAEAGPVGHGATFWYIPNKPHCTPTDYTGRHALPAIGALRGGHAVPELLSMRYLPSGRGSCHLATPLTA